MSEHREKAVEAAMERLWPGTFTRLPKAARENSEAQFRAGLDAAEPHLQRMYLERVLEAVDELRVHVFGEVTRDGDTHEEFLRKHDVRTALAKAQELMEGTAMVERRRVRLTKTSALFGRMAKGSTFVVKAREGMDPDEARVFAYKVLWREHIDENPMEWQANEEPRHA